MAWGEHIPVLAGPAIDWLRIAENGVYVDATVGMGGHASLIAARLRQGRLIGLDRDPAAVAAARERFREFSQVTILHRNYSEIEHALADLQIPCVDGVLLDAGYSSVQLSDPGRGLTFQEDGPLDMRLDTTTGISASEYLAQVDESELVQVLKDLGDVKPARRIASAIVARRRRGAMQTTRDLVDAVAEALPFVTRMPEETRTVFQAIRIVVNDELHHLAEGLRAAIRILAPGGRLVVIGFHSGEDRVIKNILREQSRMWRDLYPDGRVRALLPPAIRVLTPKPVLPTDDEIRFNTRAHSAKLRVAERLDQEGLSK